MASKIRATGVAIESRLITLNLRRMRAVRESAKRIGTPRVGRCSLDGAYHKDKPNALAIARVCTVGLARLGGAERSEAVGVGFAAGRGGGFGKIATTVSAAVSSAMAATAAAASTASAAASSAASRSRSSRSASSSAAFKV